MIVAREWLKMAEREDLKYCVAPEVQLAPESHLAELEARLRSLAKSAKT
jgi:hypothetical protein